MQDDQVTVATQSVFRRGERIRVRGQDAIFVRQWGAGAVIRYDWCPHDPKVVPIARIERALAA